MQSKPARTIRQDLDQVTCEIELLEQQLEAKRALKAQFEAELTLAHAFPEGSGFTRQER